MKTNKRTLAILTAGLLAVTPMAVGMTAFAADSITINNVADDADGAHQYEAYCIIKGTELSDGILKGISLGDNVVSLDALRTALKGSGVTKLSSLADDADLQKIVEALEEVTDDADKQKIAKALNSTSVLKDPSVPLKQDETTKKYSANVANKGWYLITDTAGTGNKVVSTNLLQVLGEETVDPKFSLPTLDKKIVTDKTTDPVTKDEKNTADIGDVVDYELTSVVPVMTGYDKYFFVINDRMASGLTFDNTSVKVYIGNEELKNTETKKYFRVDEGNDAKVGNVQYTFQIVMNDFIQHKDKAGQPIKVTYSAKLNENADITTTGNPNEVFLTYSNNPNTEAKPESNTNPDEPKVPDSPPDTPDNPGDDYDSPVGVTPWDKVNTFTTAIKLLKVDNKDNPLKGATFKLTGNGISKVLKSAATFTQADDGTYYPLKDGTYTTTAPTEGTADKYTGGTSALRYKQVITFSVDGAATANDISAAVDDSGMLIFKGLGAGQYILEETGTPTGYNTIDDITINISNDKAANAFSATNPNWKVTKKVGTETATELTANDNMYEFKVVNVKGTTLPTTGGMGTRLFYIVGGLLVAGSLVLLVTKKRMAAKEN